MIVCNLTKPEATLDQVRKTYPKLTQTDAAQLAIALVLTGEYALAHYDGETYAYPEDVDKLTKALSVQMNQIQLTVGETKKAKAAAAEEEPVEVRIGLSCNLSKGEQALGDSKSLKALLGEAVQKGVEYQFGPTEIRWQWALDRANWNTISGGELTRRVKVKALFQDSTLGTEIGTTTKRRAPKAPKVDVVSPAEEPVADLEETIPAEPTPS